MLKAVCNKLWFWLIDSNLRTTIITVVNLAEYGCQITNETKNLSYYKIIELITQMLATIDADHLPRYATGLNQIDNGLRHIERRGRFLQ